MNIPYDQYDGRFGITDTEAVWSLEKTQDEQRAYDRALEREKDDQECRETALKAKLLRELDEKFERMQLREKDEKDHKERREQEEAEAERCRKATDEMDKRMKERVNSEEYQTRQRSRQLETLEKKRQKEVEEERTREDLLRAILIKTQETAAGMYRVPGSNQEEYGESRFSAEEGAVGGTSGEEITGVTLTSTPHIPGASVTSVKYTMNEKKIGKFLEANKNKRMSFRVADENNRFLEMNLEEYNHVLDAWREVLGNKRKCPSRYGTLIVKNLPNIMIEESGRATQYTFNASMYLNEEGKDMAWKNGGTARQRAIPLTVNVSCYNTKAKFHFQGRCILSTFALIEVARKHLSKTEKCLGMVEGLRKCLEEITRSPGEKLVTQLSNDGEVNTTDVMEIQKLEETGFLSIGGLRYMKNEFKDRMRFSPRRLVVAAQFEVDDELLTSPNTFYTPTETPSDVGPENHFTFDFPR